MIEKLQHRYALSERGAKDLVQGVIACTVQNIAFMFPVSLLYFFVGDLLDGGIHGSRIAFYVVGALFCLALIYGITYWQYNTTFLATYVETGTRRITLAEKLRKIPLSFFGKKDLADLTSTIMADCTALETAFSHFIPPFAGSLISTVLIAVSLFFFDWRMAAASLWVLPVAYAIVGFSAKVQQKLSDKSMGAKMACADGIQECIESVQDLKANNAEADYLVGLYDKIDAVEHQAVKCEFGTAVFVTSANMILKLGIATTALVGAALLLKGSLDVLTFFLFLLVVSRLYDPMQAALQNLAAIISIRTNVGRMNEILDHPVQDGREELTNRDYDIKFDHVTFSYNKKENVLKDLSFTAKQGEVTAFVGPSGSGKTTVSRLAARFWDPDAGKITVGGMDIAKIEPETLLSLYSIVFQDVTLFNSSIMKISAWAERSNGRRSPGSSQTCQLRRLCRKTAEGIRYGDRRKRQSAVRRRAAAISIARAFLKNAPIILLDEATASLDVENETMIQTALSRLIRDKTVIVIAHRMRTVAGADKIIVLSEGQMAEEGTAEELLRQDGIYAQMVRLQTQSLGWTIV